MAIQHCKRPKAAPSRPCRHCSTLTWELSGLRQRLTHALAERDELQRRLYKILADTRYAT